MKEQILKTKAKRIAIPCVICWNGTYAPGVDGRPIPSFPRHTIEVGEVAEIHGTIYKVERELVH